MMFYVMSSILKEREVLLTADRLAQSVEHRTAMREVAGSNLGRTNTQGLQITDEKMLPT